MFFISSNGNQAVRRLGGTNRETLMKSTHAFNADGDKLMHQTEAILPITEHELRLDAPLTFLDAWANALARAQNRAKTRRNYAADIWRQILQFYAIPSGSTNGIERTVLLPSGTWASVGTARRLPRSGAWSWHWLTERCPPMKGLL